jgi:hypothetical protein
LSDEISLSVGRRQVAWFLCNSGAGSIGPVRVNAASRKNLTIENIGFGGEGFSCFADLVRIAQHGLATQKKNTAKSMIPK